jgi:hypothetical protein
MVEHGLGFLAGCLMLLRPHAKGCRAVTVSRIAIALDSSMGEVGKLADRKS